MYCNLLYALDPDSAADYPKQFFDKQRDSILQDIVKHSPSIINKDDLSATSMSYIHDSVKSIVQKVLDNDPSIPGHIRAAFLEDLNKAEDLIRKEGNDQAKAQVATFATRGAFLAVQMANSTFGVWGSVQNARRLIPHPVQSIKTILSIARDGDRSVTPSIWALSRVWPESCSPLLIVRALVVGAIALPVIEITLREDLSSSITSRPVGVPHPMDL